MKKRRSAARFAATAMALLLLPSSLFLFTACGEGESGAYTPEVQSVTTESGGASAQAAAVTPLKSYNLEGATEEWIAAGGAAHTVGEGVSFPGGFKEVAASYSVENPLYGEAADGFTVLLNVKVTGTINHYESMFGFSDSAAPAQMSKTFTVSGSGEGVHLNRVGEGDPDPAVDDGSEYWYYDIRPSTDTSKLDMSSASRFALTVDASAIKIYLNGKLKHTYEWVDRAGSNNTANYNYDTLGYVDAAEYFNLGASCSWWGQPEMTVSQVAFYDRVLTETDLQNTGGGQADYTALYAQFERADELVFSNYDTSASGWTAAYGAYNSAMETAQALDYFTVEQTAVDAAADALKAAIDGLAGFYREPDLTQGLYAAYPLGGSGANLVGSDKDTVKYMNGSALTEITSALSVTKQRLAGTKLYDESNLHPRDLWDMSATSTTGLKIPADAFSSSMQTSGMTLSVSIYAETLYKPWARILQLGTKGSGDGYSDGTGLYFAYSDGGILCVENKGLLVYTNDITSPKFCTVIAGEWTDVSVVFDAFSHSITFYVSSAATARSYGTETSSYGSIRAELSESAFNAVYSAVLNGKDNWIGRSFWSVDGNQVAYARNLSVYERALTPDEVALLHETDDLASLVA